MRQIARMRYRLRTLLIAVTALAIYLAAYKAVMVPRVYDNEGKTGTSVFGYRAPSYRLCDSAARIVFWPLAFIDQRSRPGYWGQIWDEQDPFVREQAAYDTGKE